jgi:hypothetical protein
MSWRWSLTFALILWTCVLGLRICVSANESMVDWKSKLVLGILTAVAMLLLTFAIPRGGSFLRDAQAAQFPVTVGVWTIFVLLFVKLK